MPLKAASIGNSIFDGTDKRIFLSPNPQAEVSLAIDNSNPLRLMTTAITTLGGGPGWYASSDGGENWIGSDSYPTSSAHGQDPVMICDDEGTFYLFTKGSSSLNGIMVSKTTDFGISWVTYTEVDYRKNEEGRPYADKEAAISDNYTGSPYKGRLYVAWTDFHTDNYLSRNKTVFSYSTNKGQNWSITLLNRGY